MSGRHVADTDRHGHHHGYQCDGCRCRPCTDAHNVELRRDELERARGNPRHVDAAPAQAWAAALGRLWGVSPTRVVQDAAGLTVSGAHLAVYRSTHIRRANHTAVMAAGLDDLGGTAPMWSAPARFMRDELLDRHGWTMEQLGKAVGVPAATLRLSGERCRVGVYRALRDRLRAEAHYGVCEDCDDLAHVPGGRWCYPHFNEWAESRRAKRDARVSTIKRRQAYEQHRSAA